tara:strand:- start:4870 stop:5163 length:294 start_codon:yes stop_codon:yes gene_type:complete
MATIPKQPCASPAPAGRILLVLRKLNVTCAPLVNIKGMLVHHLATAMDAAMALFPVSWVLTTAPKRTAQHAPGADTAMMIVQIVPTCALPGGILHPL